MAEVTITGDAAAKLSDVKSGDDICVTVGEITTQDDGTFTAQCEDAYKMEGDQSEPGDTGAEESGPMPKGKMAGMRPAVALILSHGGK